jgi:hypothetical protein
MGASNVAVVEGGVVPGGTESEREAQRGIVQDAALVPGWLDLKRFAARVRRGSGLSPQAAGCEEQASQRHGCDAESGWFRRDRCRRHVDCDL